MKQYQLKTTYQKVLADTHTPVSIYLKIRDRFPNSILLESSDYHGQENSFSYICFNPIASIKVENEQIQTTYPDGREVVEAIDDQAQVAQAVSNFAACFITEPNPFEFIHNGLFGYIGYDAVRYFEDITITQKTDDLQIPELLYSVFSNIIAINHFKNEAFLFSYVYDNAHNLDEVAAIINTRAYASYHFQAGNDETSNFTDEEFMEGIDLAKQHCYRGDVFQMVLSRRFSQSFKGDEFNVYRSLRSINPSPYLFYFDYGSFKIFGSSPEAQLVVKDNQATIHPIAGTFRRTGNDQADAVLAEKLTNDPKENAEHVMLVDLARNDLSRHGENVKVATYKEVQYYSHVIHLVSKVTAQKEVATPTMNLVGATFPAGTLSGAPKHKAMQLIDRYEKENRSFYGGCIGFMDFNGDFNNAIIIRSFLSKDNRLHYQAGAGIVAESNTENELQEVYNKLEALQKALEMANNIQ